MRMRQSLGACVFLLTYSAPVLAQTPVASFSQLIAEDALREKQTIYVTDVWGNRVKGRLGEIRPGSLVLLHGAREVPLAEVYVTRIQRGDSIANGLLLGLGAGFAAGWMSTHLLCDLPDDECAGIVFAAIGFPSMAGGAVAGALIDAAIRKTVFRVANTGAARIKVSPVVTARRAGAFATIRF
jgi:hypothetical protein